MMPDSPSLEDYIDAFRLLRKDKNSTRYPAHTRHAAPHKPLLLLAVIDLFEKENVSENLIPLTPSLCDLFNSYWSRVMPSDWYGDVALPFFHLTGDEFWHLVPRSGSEPVLEAGRRLRSIRLLHDHTRGAQLDDELYTLLSTQETRETLRNVLITAHFTEDVHDALFDQGHVNVESFKYSRALLEQARQHQRIKEEKLDSTLPEQVRDQGFRHAVVDAYDHRCAISGIRILTSDFHTAVEAAHIIPWSISQNDDPRNGLALSKLCHWAFDEGLLTVMPSYRIRLSSELTADHNAPGYLSTLDRRTVHLPDEEAFWPDPDHLDWHNRKRFRS